MRTINVHKDIIVAVSNTADGSMKISGSANPDEIRTNREKFLAANTIQPADTTLVQLVYEGNNYCRFSIVGDDMRGDGLIRPSSVVADGLMTTRTNQALFLPLADCIGAVLYDPTKKILMLSHLGRHNLEQFGARKSVDFMTDKRDVSPTNLIAWLSPAAGADNYPLFSFDNRSMHDVAIEQLLQAGVRRDSINISPIDTTADNKYYSHSQYKKSNRSFDGRFAVVAMMKP